ncbi:MAG: zf-HC2 domain-containing protein [candidate division WOR-3 bacterium]
MKDCRFKDKVIEYFEKLMDDKDKIVFENHLKDCSACQEQLSTMQKIYEIMDKDEISLPEKEFFERLKNDIRRKEVYVKKPFWKIFGILAPVLGILIFIVLVNFRKEQSVEIAIPTSYFTQDAYLNTLFFERIVDNGIVNQFNLLDEYFVVDIDEGLQELTTEQKEKLLELMSKKYGEEFL